MSACASIACDACPKPGRCCTGLVLNNGTLPPAGSTTLEAYGALAAVATVDAHGRPMLGLPFLPFAVRPNGEWMLWCQNLLPSGRCGDYEHRPALCAAYTAGDDWLCAMYTPRIEDAL